MSQENKITSVEQAISVLVQAAKIGQSKGAYSLEDASMIAMAIQSLAPQQPAPAPTAKVDTAPTEEG